VACRAYLLGLESIQEAEGVASEAVHVVPCGCSSCRNNLASSIERLFVMAWVPLLR